MSYHRFTYPKVTSVAPHVKDQGTAEFSPRTPSQRDLVAASLLRRPDRAASAAPAGRRAR